MKRLKKENLNTPQEYNRIFYRRQQEGLQDGDVRRWEALIKKFKGGKMIDIGCLDSMIPNLIKEKDFKYLGIDLAGEAISIMQTRYTNEPKIRYEVRDCYKTGLPDKYFDYVVMGEVLEHLEEPLDAIQEALRILKSGGYLATSTPLNEAQDPGAVDLERHLWSYTIRDMQKILQPFGKVTNKVLGSVHFPVYKYYFPTLITYLKKK